MDRHEEASERLVDALNELKHEVRALNIRLRQIEELLNPQMYPQPTRVTIEIG